MKQFRKRLCLLSGAANVVFTECWAKSGQNGAATLLGLCSQRRWRLGKCFAPVMLDIDGRLLGPMVGITFTAGSPTNGIKMGEVPDHEFRNRVGVLGSM